MGLFSKLFGGHDSSEEEPPVEPVTFSTPLTEKYGYDSAEAMPFSGSYQAFERAVESYAEKTGATLIHEQDGSITTVLPGGKKMTAYYQS